MALTEVNFNYTKLSDIRSNNILSPIDHREQQDWHKLITEETRKESMIKVVKCFVPSNDPNFGLSNKKVQILVKYARKIESELFEDAQDIEEYNNFLEEKLIEIDAELSTSIMDISSLVDETDETESTMKK